MASNAAILTGALSLRAQQATAGDPKRPQEVVKYTKPETDPDKQMPDVMLLIASIFAMLGVTMKIKVCSWIALACIASALAKADSSLDLKQLIQATMFSLFGLSTSYIIPFYQSRKMEKEGITAAAMASGQAPFS